MIVTLTVAVAACGSASAPPRPHSSGSAASGAGLAPAPAPAPVSSATVTISKYAYHPAVLRVRPGARVTFVNRDATAHTATSSAATAMFDTGTLGPGRSRTLTFRSAGSFAYYCQFHAFMHGTVIVVK